MLVAEIGKNGNIKNRVLKNRPFLIQKHDDSDNMTLAKVWASYIFVFIALLITFSIIFSVGYLINSMAYQGSKAVASKTFNPSHDQFFQERSISIMRRVREYLKKASRNSTMIQENHKTRYLHSKVLQGE
ncbi:hypothetical protein FO519_000432 [Halicephalobus sp. NKZ332]|nr:hypothetical protein FO519_000432 [Halicephalobus sp. NKZ332]